MAEIEGRDSWPARHWRPLLLLFWLLVAGYMLFDRWGAVRGFALGDTDDNMRMMQVRALLEGQGWYDLRQYRLNPPFGADIHWSRLVDLPIAAIKLLLTPLLGGRMAEMTAAAVAPLLPMLVAMAALAVTVRRLVDGRAFAIAIALIACAGSARGMWAPLRLDHHGWQRRCSRGRSGAERSKRGRAACCSARRRLVAGDRLELLLYLAWRARRPCCAGSGTGTRRKGCSPWRRARRRLRARLLVFAPSQPRAGLRRALAGLALGDGRRRRDPVALASLIRPALGAARAAAARAAPRSPAPSRSPGPIASPARALLARARAAWLSKVRGRCLSIGTASAGGAGGDAADRRADRLCS